MADSTNGSYSSFNEPKLYEEVEPEDAWKMLKEDDDTVIVDVRRLEEWNNDDKLVLRDDLTKKLGDKTFIGVPKLGRDKLLLITWKDDNYKKDTTLFANIIKKFFDKNKKILFLCAHGIRSGEACQLMAKNEYTNCYNVLGGMAGNLDQSGFNSGTCDGVFQANNTDKNTCQTQTYEEAVKQGVSIITYIYNEEEVQKAVEQFKYAEEHKDVATLIDSFEVGSSKSKDQKSSDLTP